MTAADLPRADQRRNGGRGRGPRRPPAHGFTLIEVLVALAVVAVTLGAGIKAAGSLTSNTARLTDVTAAQWCADNRLTALKLAHQYPDIGDGDFSCDELGRTYAGRLVVRPTPNPNFRRVDARILDADGRQILLLSTILGRL
jgi:general secretion pathway protein I